MIKRSHLRQFLAVVETGNFTRAAERIAVSQPTLSAGIAELERQMGARLFLRERRSIRLTEAGNRLLTHARAIEREFRLAEASLAAAPVQASALRLGVIGSLSTEMLGRIVAAWSAQGPLLLIEGSDAELRRRLGDGQIDAALTLLRRDEQDRGAPLVLEEDYVMMLAETHPLAGRTRLDATELAGETMIARRSCELLAETSRFFTQRGIRPAFFLRSANDDRCMAMVGAGMGITTAPRSLERAGVIAVPLQDYDFRRSLGLVLPPHGPARALESELIAACAAG